MSTEHHSSRKKRILIITVILIAVIVGVRLTLPYVVLRYANHTLANMKGYRGHIEDIDLAILRGAYKIDSIYVNKYDSGSNKQTPFFSSKLVDLSVEWKALFKGSVVGELVFVEPKLRFTKDKVEPKQVQKDTTDFRKLLKDLMPLKVNRFEVKDGTIQYIDEFSKPPVNVKMTNTHILALNLRNAYDSGSVLPASVKASANVYDGTLDFNMKLNPLAEVPTYDMNAELKNTNLVKLNDFFKAYANVDVNKGTFGMYTEIAAKDGRFTGYVKPLLKDLKVLGKEDKKDNIFKKLWEAVVGAAGDVFKNHPKDQVATKIPFKGDVENPKANIWYSISQVLQNAFIRAIQPSLDNEINIATVDKGEKKEEKKNFLEKIFSGKDKDDKKKEDDKDKKSKREKG